VRLLCEQHDVLFLQEHWLREDELSKLNTLHPDFNGYGISAMKTDSSILRGRPYGGVCVLWRKSLSNSFKIMRFDDTRILGCTLAIDDDVILFINVYLPYQCDDNFDNYVQHLGILSSIIHESSTPAIVVVGDFNAKVGSIFENELINFVNENNMHVSDYEHFGRYSSQYTYVSDAHASTSWLDHYVCSSTMHNSITKITFIDKPPSSDHLPISAVFSHSATTAPMDVDTNDEPPTAKSCNWFKASPGTL